MTTAEKLVLAKIPAEQANAIVGDVDGSVTSTGSTSQANSYAIRAAVTQVTTNASGGGVRLPAANKGDSFDIANWTTGNNLLLYPPTGGKLNGGSANASLTIATAKSARAVCVNTVDYSVVVGA